MRVSASSLDKDVHYYLNNGLGSIVLLVATGVALIFANIAKTAPLYELFWSSYIGPKALNLSMTLHHWVNEGLMALFFFSVGLEIKREFIKFETSHFTVLWCCWWNASSDAILFGF
jgi:Na+/H+ antiporter NhaA